MAKRSTKSPKKLTRTCKTKDTPRNFNVAEITFIKANPNMTVEDLADALNASEGEIYALRGQYPVVPAPEPTNKMIFIKDNAANMTVKQMAVALHTTEQEVDELIKGYNTANRAMILQSFVVGKDKKRGTVVATEVSSQLSDTKNSMTGPASDGFIKPLKEVDFIFKTRPDAI